MRLIIPLLSVLSLVSVQAETVWLTWSPSPSTNVAGYKVYSGPTAGQYNRAVSAPASPWSTNLPPNTTHFFAVTTVSVNTLESRFSNEVSWQTAPTNQPPTNPQPAEVIIDNPDAGYVGSWQVSTKYGGYLGVDYVHDNNSDKGSKKVFFRPRLTPGRYEVAVWYPEQRGNTSVCLKVPVKVTGSSVSDTVFVNQSMNTSQWNVLGVWPFAGGTNESVIFDNINPGQVTVDAVRFRPVP